MNEMNERKRNQKKKKKKKKIRAREKNRAGCDTKAPPLEEDFGER